MSVDPSDLRYSITITTHDTAVLYCLRALWHYALDHQDPSAVPGLTPPGESTTDDGTVTFRFSDPRQRSEFLGEATRLLAGKWMRHGTSDSDPAPG